MSSFVGAWIGLRYLRSKKTTAFLNFITFLSIAGIIVGITSMIVVLSVMSGFEAELRDRLLSTDLHILVSPTKESKQFELGRVPRDAFEISHPNDLRVHPVLATEAVLRVGRKAAGVSLKGIEEDRLGLLEGSITDRAETQFLFSEDGGARIPGIIIGREMANMLGVLPGDTVTLISPTETDGPLDSVPKMSTFVIEAIYRTGAVEQELHIVFSKIKTVENFLRKRSVVTHWEISLKDPEESTGWVSVIKKQYPSFRVQDWKELNSTLFSSLKLERFAMTVALTLIVVVASFNIITLLSLTVLEKKKDIAILKTMGAQPRFIYRIFLTQGCAIGMVGVFVGVLLALMVCLLLQNYEIIRLPDVYYDTHLPVVMKVGYFLGISAAAFVVVLLSSTLPSRQATQISILEGLKT